jgi:hypothetical protein
VAVDEFHAVLFQFIGNRAKNRVRIFLLQPQQHAHGPKIGAEVEQVFGRDLAGHDALLHAPAGEGGNHLADLADVEPDEVVHERGERGIGFALGGDGDDAFDAGGAGQPGEFERQRAAAGNEADGFKRQIHAIQGKQFSGLDRGIQPGIAPKTSTVSL